MKYELTDTLSPTEVLARLIECSELIIDSQGHNRIVMDEGVIKHMYKGELTGASVDMPTKYDIYEVVMDKWYENISDIGVLVHTGGHIACLGNYNKSNHTLENKYNGDTFNIEFLTPLTEQEIKQFLPVEKHWTDNLCTDNPIECYYDQYSEESALEDGCSTFIVSFEDGIYKSESGNYFKYAIPVDESLR